MIKNIKNIIKEQLGTGYNCEADVTSPTGTACIQNQIGAGTFIDLPACLASGCEGGYSGEFSCHDDGTCQPDPYGQFNSMNDCLDYCAALKPACLHGSSGGRECYYCPGPTKEKEWIRKDYIREKYQPTTSPVGCKIVGNDIGRLTDGTNLYNSSLECEDAESACTDISVDTEQCQCCSNNSQAYGAGPHIMPGRYAVGKCGLIPSIGASLNPNGWLSHDWHNCAPYNGTFTISCPVKKKMIKRDMESIREETNRFKRLIKEQLGSGVNCEVDPTSPSGFACVNNQVGAGQFVDMAACIASGCQGVDGCTDQLANNYNQNATIDDGSCTYDDENCCDDCANFPNNFIGDSSYPNIGRFCAGCAIAAGTTVIINNPSNPSQTYYGLPMNIPVHSVGTTANADGQDYCCDCCNQGHLPWPVTSIPNAAMDDCGNVVNGEHPVDEPKCNHGECYYCPASFKKLPIKGKLNEKAQNYQYSSSQGCEMIGPINLNQALDNGTNLYQTIAECEAAESGCSDQSVDTTQCQCCQHGTGAHVMPGIYADCGQIPEVGASLNPNSWTQYNWYNCTPYNGTLTIACKDKKKTWMTKDKMESINEETNRFNLLISEQLGSGVNCELDATSPSGYSCVTNQFGAGQFVDMAACLAAGCETPTCPAGHSWNGWPSGYPTDQPFTWNGPPINMNFGGAVFNFPTGSMIPGTYANWFNAGQSSYCEWCADWDSGNAGGGSTNSQGFDLRTDVWVGGGYGPEACACCPPTNGMGSTLPRQGGIFLCSNRCEPSRSLPNNDEEIFASQSDCMESCGFRRDEGDTDEVCCNWCQDSGGRGTPPRGCYDFDCDYCSDIGGDDSDFFNLREDIEDIRLLHKKRSIIKGNE